MVEGNAQEQVQQGRIRLLARQGGNGTENILFGEGDRHGIRIHGAIQMRRGERTLHLFRVGSAEDPMPEPPCNFQAAGTRLCERDRVTACLLPESKSRAQHRRHDTDFRGHGKGIDPLLDGDIHAGKGHPGRRVNRLHDGVKEILQILLGEKNCHLPALPCGSEVGLDMTVQHRAEAPSLGEDRRGRNITFFMDHDGEHGPRQQDGDKQECHTGKHPFNGFFHDNNLRYSALL